MKIKKLLLKPSAILTTLVLVGSGVLPFLNSAMAQAYGLVTARSIELSNSTAAATNTIYTLSFTTATTNNIAGMVVDFCSSSPIIGDTCTAPSGFDTVKATLALANQSGITGWSVDTTNSTARTLILTRSSSSITSGTVASIDLGTATNGITNPSTTNSSYYARVLTYATAANAQAYTDTVPGAGNIDAGGVALSTANNITVTAKVQEQLTFCVYTGANCGAGGSTVTLGDTNGVLRSSGPFVDVTTQYDVATNAASGVAIRLKGDTLKTGSFSIASIGSSATSSSAGTSQFGLCTYQTTGAGLTPAAPYNNANCNTTTQTAGTSSTGGAGTAQFALDTANTVSTYGQVIANKTAGTTSKGIIPFIGNISVTQQAGIYTTTLIFIATGIY